LFQIEDKAVKLIADFQQKLEEAGLEVPPIPPIPVEYLALTVTEFGVRGVKGLECEGRSLSGLLDPETCEILYEENEASQRQNFSIAHELGHYFLHYLPLMQPSEQPTLFELEDLEPDEPVRYFRCDSSEISTGETEEEASSLKAVLKDTQEQAKLAKIISFKQRADRYEWEANIFAAGLLMPRELVQWLYTKHDGDVGAIAHELQVSRRALVIRLNDMKLQHDEAKLFRGNNPRKKDNHSQGSLF
jgi:Zn-dependent peptidase ImmA (M78 family)